MSLNHGLLGQQNNLIIIPNANAEQIHFQIENEDTTGSGNLRIDDDANYKETENYQDAAKFIESLYE